jgi:hypothetical protein
MTRLEDTPEMQELIRLFQEMTPQRQDALLDYLDREATTDVVQEPDEGLTLSPELVARIHRFQRLPEDRQLAILDTLARKNTTDVLQYLTEVLGHED